MDNMQINKSNITFTATFDEAAFQNYTELYLRNRDRASAWWFVVYFGLGIIFILFISYLINSDNKYIITVMTILFLFCLRYFLLGISMIFRIRHPRWGKKRWNARTYIAFDRLRQHDLKNPLCMGLNYKDIPNDNWPEPFRPYFLLYFIIGSAYIGDSKFSQPLAYDTIPGILPRFKDVPEDVELSVQFSGAFYSDHIEKGSHGIIFAESYSDIHDVVEDQKRYPGLAILRHKDGYSELVVFTDKLEGGTWDEVKLRIFEACPDAFSIKETMRLTALQNSLCEKGEL